jgi:hypothetical protein
MEPALLALRTTRGIVPVNFSVFLHYTACLEHYHHHITNGANAVGSAEVQHDERINVSECVNPNGY